MNKLGIAIVIVCLIPLTIWALDIYYDGQTIVIIEAPTYLYANEFDAAYAYGLLNGKQPKPLLALTSDDKLVVTRTTFGKDYWALQVETSNGDSGWISSGQEGIKIIKP